MNARFRLLFLFPPPSVFFVELGTLTHTALHSSALLARVLRDHGDDPSSAGGDDATGNHRRAADDAESAAELLQPSQCTLRYFGTAILAAHLLTLMALVRASRTGRGLEEPK